MAKTFGSPGDEYGDQRVFKLLKQLPCHFHIYAQPKIQYGYDLCFPDYVVVDPTQGLIVLEVKDWTTVLEANIDHARIMRGKNGGKVWEKSPTKQARTYSYKLRNALKKDPQLIQHWGQYQGKLKFPVEYAGFLPHQPDNVVTALEKVWGRKRVFGKRELENPGCFQSILDQFPYHFTPKNELSGREIKYIHSYLLPHIIIQKISEFRRVFYQPSSRRQCLPVSAA